MHRYLLPLLPLLLVIKFENNNILNITLKDLLRIILRFTLTDKDISIDVYDIGTCTKNQL